MMKCETGGEVIHDCQLDSPVEVTAPDVTFERVRFLSVDPQHTLLTTGANTHVTDCDFLGNYYYGGRRGICVNSGGVVITKTRFRDLFHSQDAQCIAGWDGTKDLLIEDCYGEASGENVIFGGADASSEAAIPADITMRRCTWTKPVRWQSKPNGCTVKNLFELKNAKRVLVEDCDMSYSWPDGQTGFGIVLTVRNQDGGNPYATVEDVTIRRTVVRDTVSGLQILGTDDTHPSGVMRRITFHRVRFNYTTGDGVQLGNGAEGLSFTLCNFWAGGNNKWLAFNCPQRPITGLTITDSDAHEGWYGILGDDSSPGVPTLEKYAPGAVFTNVTVNRGGSGSNYPYPAGITVV
jgi:hypothetical protein